MLSPDADVGPSYLVEVWELLVPDQSLFVGELPPAEQAGQLGPVGQLLLDVAGVRLPGGLLGVTVSAVGGHQATLINPGMNTATG